MGKRICSSCLTYKYSFVLGTFWNGLPELLDEDPKIKASCPMITEFFFLPRLPPCPLCLQDP